MFTPAHDLVILYSVETAPPPDLLDTGLMAAYPAAPIAPVVLGYTNVPQNSRGLSNSKGFAVGQQGAAYNKRGMRKPTISVSIKPGSVAALQDLFPDANGKLPYLAIFVVVKGQYTVVYRHCKPSSLDFNFGGAAEGGNELSVTANFMAIDRQEIAALTVTPAQLRALGTPLMWHDVRRFNLTNNAGVLKNYRKDLINLTVKVDYSLEAKSNTSFYGDNAPSSITAFELMEHQQKVDGEMSLHSRLTRALFDGAVRAQDWESIVIGCSDVEAAKGFDLTVNGPFPSDETMNGVESNAELDFAVPFTADSLTLDLI